MTQQEILKNAMNPLGEILGNFQKIKKQLIFNYSILAFNLIILPVIFIYDNPTRFKVNIVFLILIPFIYLDYQRYKKIKQIEKSIKNRDYQSKEDLIKAQKETESLVHFIFYTKYTLAISIILFFSFLVYRLNDVGFNSGMGILSNCGLILLLSICFYFAIKNAEDTRKKVDFLEPLEDLKSYINQL